MSGGTWPAAGPPEFERLPRREEPGRGELRRFGATLAGGFGAVAALLLWRGHGGPAAVPALLAALLLAQVLAEPARLATLRRRWTAGARALSRATNGLLLGLLFYLMATPMGTVARWLGWDPLDRNPRAGDTYWKGREPRDDAERYHRPY